MKRPLSLVAGVAALTTLLNLAGCAVLNDEGAYHYEHGDRVANDGSIRYVGWCEARPHNAQCAQAAERDSVAAAAVASLPPG